MASVLDAAAYLLQQAETEGAAVTHLKLQKLCYYAQGYSLALLAEPMFAEPIEAWEHGPVIRALWDEYRQYKSAPIPAPAHGVKLEPWRTQLLDEVHRRFGWMTAWDLRNRTHDEIPWREAWQSGADNAQLQHESLRDFFRAALRGARRAPEPADRRAVWARLEQDEELRQAVQRGRADAAAGRLRRWN